MKVFRLIVILTIGILTACSSSDSQLPTQVILPTDIPTEQPTSTPTPTPTITPSPTPTAQPVSLPSSTNESASVAFLHALNGFEQVDIYVEATAYAFAMGYGQNTQASDISAGTYTIRLMPAGTSPRDNIAPYLLQQVELAPQTTTVLVIMGTTQTPQLTPFVLSNVPLDAGQARISLVNFVENVPNLNLRQNGIDIALPVVYGQQTIPANIASGQATIALHTGETTLLTEVLSLRERENVTLFAYGNPATATGVRFVRFNNRVSGRTTIRLVNISPAATLIDVYMNDTLFFSNADYGRISDRQQITAGDYRVAVYTGGADISRATPLYTTTFTPRQDDSTILVFMGGEGSLNLATVRDDRSSMPPGQARMIFINALPNSGVVQPSYQVGDIPLVGRIAYGQATNGILMDAGLQFLYFMTNSGTEQIPVEITENLMLEEGFSYLYFITGRDETVPPVMLGEKIGVDESLTITYDTQPTQAPVLPIRAQVVNMLLDRAPIDVYIDNSPVATNLPHAQLSAPVIVGATASDFATVSVRLPYNASDLALRQYPFQRDFVHTIYIYGNTVEAPRIEVRVEQALPETSDRAYVRLNNFTTNADVRFNLSVADAAIEPVRPIDFTPLPVVQYREEMFANAQPVIVDIAGNQISRVASIPARLSDIYIIDIELGLVAYKQLDVNFEAGRIYDIIAIQNSTDIQVNVWIITHPPLTG